MTFERTWFKCFICRCLCSTSILTPGYEDKPAKICTICNESYCPTCDTKLKPVIPRGHGLGVFCPECGYGKDVSREVYENIKDLNGEGS